MEDIDYSKPFQVKIIQDCRSDEDYGISGKLDGFSAICLGMFVYPNTYEKPRVEADGTPLLLTESGDYIWGCECWFDPEPEKNKDSLELQLRCLEIHKGLLRKTFGIDVDPSLN